MCSHTCQSERRRQQQFIEELEIFKIKGRDRRGRKILRIVGKFFPCNPSPPFFCLQFCELSNENLVFDTCVSFLFRRRSACLARSLSVDVVNKHLEEKVYPRLGKKAFSVVYVHTGVQRCENFPGISALRSIYEGIPVDVKENLQAVYFVHPDLQARLFLATFGRLLFSGGW